MSVFANPIGQTSTGITALSPAGIFSGIAPTSGGQTLQASGANTFEFTNKVPFSAGAGVIQVLTFTPTTTMNVTVVGGATTVYTPSAQFFSFSFNLLQPASNKVYATWALSCNFPSGLAGGNAVAWCGYLNATGSPLISSYQGNFNTGSGLLSSTRAAALLGTNMSGPQTFNLCAYAGVSSSVPTAPYDSSAVTIWEVSTIPVSPFSISISSATAVLCLSFPIAANSSLAIAGDWVAFNNTTVSGAAQGGNGGSFFCVGIRGSGNVAISNNNVVMNQVLAFGSPPYIYFLANTITQAIEIYGVGITGQTFNFKFNFTTN